MTRRTTPPSLPRALRLGLGAAAAAASLAAMACGDTASGPVETGAATVEFVTYPGEVEAGNVALFTLLGYLPTPCDELTEAGATLDEDRISLAARWRRSGDGACPGVVEPFETRVSLEVPAGWDSLAVTVADSVWDWVPVLVDAPGFKKAAGELADVGPSEEAPDCHRGLTAASSRIVLLSEPMQIDRPFVVGRFHADPPEACRDAGLEDVLGTLDVESAY